MADATVAEATTEATVKAAVAGPTTVVTMVEAMTEAVEEYAMAAATEECRYPNPVSRGPKGDTKCRAAQPALPAELRGC